MLIDLLVELLLRFLAEPSKFSSNRERRRQMRQPLKRAGTLVQEGQYERARVQLGAALALRPDTKRLVADATQMREELARNRKVEDMNILEIRRRSLAIQEKELGPEHPHVALSLNKLAELYRNQGRYAEAEPLYRRSLAIREKALAPEHPDVARTLNDLALLFYNQGKYAEAGILYQRCLAILEKALGPHYPDLVTVLENYACLLRKADREAEAPKTEVYAKAIRAKQPQVNLNN